MDSDQILDTFLPASWWDPRHQWWRNPFHCHPIFIQLLFLFSSAFSKWFPAEDGQRTVASVFYICCFTSEILSENWSNWWAIIAFPAQFNVVFCAFLANLLFWNLRKKFILLIIWSFTKQFIHLHNLIWFWPEFPLAIFSCTYFTFCKIPVIFFVSNANLF